MRTTTDSRASDFNAQTGQISIDLVGNVLSNNSRNGFAYAGFGPSSTTATFTNNFIVFNGADPFAPGNLRDGVLLQAFTEQPERVDRDVYEQHHRRQRRPDRRRAARHGVFINVFSIGTGTTGANVSFNGDNISLNQESGIRGLFGGGAGAGSPAQRQSGRRQRRHDRLNGLDGVTIDNNQFSVLTATFDDSFFRLNAQNGILINNISLAAGEAPACRPASSGTSSTTTAR